MANDMVDKILNYELCHIKIKAHVLKTRAFALLRRVRDSNPRSYYTQQFSRLPQSTTLPTLRRKSTNTAWFCK